MIEKPENPYKKNSITWSVMEGDWEDLTIQEIAEVLLSDIETIRDTMHRIKKMTGYIVPYKKRKKGKQASELYQLRSAR